MNPIIVYNGYILVKEEDKRSCIFQSIKTCEQKVLLLRSSPLGLDLLAQSPLLFCLDQRTRSPCLFMDLLFLAQMSYLLS